MLDSSVVRKETLLKRLLLMSLMRLVLIIEKKWDLHSLHFQAYFYLSSLILIVNYPLSCSKKKKKIIHYHKDYTYFDFCLCCPHPWTALLKHRHWHFQKLILEWNQALAVAIASWPTWLTHQQCLLNSHNYVYGQLVQPHFAHDYGLRYSFIYTAQMAMS